jgi:hypothetical protein
MICDLVTGYIAVSNVVLHQMVGVLPIPEITIGMEFSAGEFCERSSPTWIDFRSVT